MVLVEPGIGGFRAIGVRGIPGRRSVPPGQHRQRED
jgi:hypothetical protein